MVTIDTNVFVALPVLALLVSFIVRQTVRVRRKQGGPRSPIPGIVIGVLGFAIGGVLFFQAEADQQAYTSDPSCRAGLFVPAAVRGPCTVAPMRIVRWYVKTSRSPSTHLVLSGTDGTEHDVTYGRNVRGDVVRGFRYNDDGAATVQWYKDAIVIVATRSGLAFTTAEPRARENRWALVSVIAGLIGIGSALRAAFMAAPLLTPAG